MIAHSRERRLEKRFDVVQQKQNLVSSSKKTVFDVDVIHLTKDKRHTTGVQRGGGEGDRQVVGEDLHRWQDQVEAQEAGSGCPLVT